MNPFEQFQKEGDEIVKLTNQIHEIIDVAVAESYFGAEELESIQSQMGDLIRQGVFWLKQENHQRFVYDLKNFLKWLIKFVETKEKS